MPQSLGGCKVKYNQNNRSELLAFYYRDHDIVEDLLEEMKLSLSGNEQWTDENRQILDDFRFFMGHELEHHLLNEEQILFPLIAEVLQEASGPISVMNTEHNLLRQLALELSDEIGQCQQKNEKTSRFSDLFSQIEELIAEHFYKENRVLFPMAEQILSDEQKAKLFQELQSRHK